MWKIIFILQLFTKETTVRPSFPAGRHLEGGRVSAGEMRRSDQTAPFRTVASRGGMGTVGRSWC